MAAFTGGLFLQDTIDAGRSSSTPVALAINVLLILLFGLQHSVMARPAFKNIWTRFVPRPIERSTYVLVSSLACILLLWQWRPMDAVVWRFDGGPGWWIMTVLFVLGWLMVPAVSLMINHFDLFGIRQVWLFFHGKPYTALPFRTPMAYGWVRHPLYLGWAIAFWCTPIMTVGHMLLASLMTVYMLVAVIFEERDLSAHFGDIYRDYCRLVPRYLPKLNVETKELAANELAKSTSSAKNGVSTAEVHV
jgi:protein-S-isoprenylcysteine O-methyltransferase Ste14